MGAALATLVTQALAAALGIAIFLRGRHGIQLAWRGLRPDLPYIKRALFLGLPGSIELSARGMGPMVMSFLAASFGTLTIAAYGVGTNVLELLTIPAMGLSMAVSTLVGQNMGAGNIERATRVTVLGAAASFVLLSLAGIFRIPLRPRHRHLLRTRGSAGHHPGRRVHPIMSLAGRDGPAVLIVAAFRASGNMLMAMVIARLAMDVPVPLAYILSRHTVLQAAGLWWPFPIADIGVAIVSVCWFAHGGWGKTRLRKRADRSPRSPRRRSPRRGSAKSSFPSGEALRAGRRSPWYASPRCG